MAAIMTQGRCHNGIDPGFGDRNLAIGKLRDEAVQSILANHLATGLLGDRLRAVLDSDAGLETRPLPTAPSSLIGPCRRSSRQPR